MSIYIFLHFHAEQHCIHSLSHTLSSAMLSFARSHHFNSLICIRCRCCALPLQPFHKNGFFCSCARDGIWLGWNVRMRCTKQCLHAILTFRTSCVCVGHIGRCVLWTGCLLAARSLAYTLSTATWIYLYLLNARRTR